MSELTEDLVEEILCRIPALSLKRLRPICKRWNRLFDDLNFKRKHSFKAPKESLFIIFKMFGFYSMSINYLHRSSPISAEITYELNLINPNPSLDEFKISQHCHSSDGLLLCYCLCSEEENSKLVVWNPYTGETKWIHICAIYKTFALGSYKDKKTGIKRYKILSHRFNHRHGTEFELYEINSDSWRVLDDINTMECTNLYLSSMKSLKGKTYWIARDEIQKQLEIFLLSFDYTTERFERLCLPSYLTMSLSVVREEKLSALVQPDHLTLKTEIWVTNKIVDDETYQSGVVDQDFNSGFEP